MGKWTAKTGKGDKAKAGEEPVVLFGGDLAKMVAAGDEMDARAKAAAPKVDAEPPVVIDVDKIAAALGDTPQAAGPKRLREKIPALLAQVAVVRANSARMCNKKSRLRAVFLCLLRLPAEQLLDASAKMPTIST